MTKDAHRITDSTGHLIGFVRPTADGRYRGFNARGHQVVTLQSATAVSTFLQQKRASR